jgi:hypothetical protein
MMPRPPPKEGAKPPRPGIKGFILDRIDYIKLAFKNYMEEAAAQRGQIDKVGKDQFGNEIKYHTRKKGKADKKAKAAGVVEKLK